MNRRAAITRAAASALLLCPFASGKMKASAIHQKFWGVWRLISIESRDKATGEVRYPYGSNPVGRLTYDASGRMSAQLMNPTRRHIGGPPNRTSAAAMRDASTDDLREILTGYAAYFGTFDIDETARTVIHHVQACLTPSWVGGDLRRTYEFTGANRLILTVSGDQAVTRLVWERDQE